MLYLHISRDRSWDRVKVATYDTVLETKTSRHMHVFGVNFHLIQNRLKARRCTHLVHITINVNTLLVGKNARHPIHGCNTTREVHTPTKQRYNEHNLPSCKTLWRAVSPAGRRHRYGHGRTTFCPEKMADDINTRLVHNFFCWMSLFIAAAANARFLTAPRAHYAREAWRIIGKNS